MSIFIYIIFGLPVFLMLLTVVAGRLEKRLVWPYGTLEQQPRFPDLTDIGGRLAGGAEYGKRWTNGALECGFSLMGWAPHVLAPAYSINYALLTSPEHDCFVVVHAGKIFKLVTFSTNIYTRTTDGKVYYTTENQAGVSIDLLGTWYSQLMPAKAFRELLQYHRDMLQSKGVAARLFTPGREIDEFRQLLETRYENMARHGLIEYIDGSRRSWHYTLWGAVRYTIVNFTIGVLRVKSGGKLAKTA